MVENQPSIAVQVVDLLEVFEVESTPKIQTFKLPCVRLNCADPMCAMSFSHGEEAE